MLSQLILLVHNNADGSSTTCNIDVATLSFMVLDTILGAFKDGACINCEVSPLKFLLLSSRWTLCYLMNSFLSCEAVAPITPHGLFMFYERSLLIYYHPALCNQHCWYCSNWLCSRSHRSRFTQACALPKKDLPCA